MIILYNIKPNCPKCNKPLEIWSRKIDNTEFGGICRNCLINVDIKISTMTQDEIMELAQES